MTSTERAVRLTARVVGEVQGVGYRAFAQRRAEVLDVAGYVRNEPDGTVRVVAEGQRASLARFLAELRQGPAGADVQSVEEHWDDATGEFDGFEIRY